MIPRTPPPSDKSTEPIRLPEAEKAFKASMKKIKQISPMDRKRLPPEKFVSENLKQVKLVNAAIGGSTAPKLVTAEGRLLIQKKPSEKGGARHLYTEYYANQAYKALGVPVSDYHLVEGVAVDDKGNIKSSPENSLLYSHYLRNMIPLRTYLQQLEQEGNTEKKDQLLDQLANHYIIDCVLGNWDVFGGEGGTNLLVDPYTNIGYRIDNGCSFESRSQGALKSKEYWSPTVTELSWLMTDKKNAPYMRLTNQDIAGQIKDLLSKRQTLLEAIPEKYHSIINARLDDLQQHLPEYEKE